MDTNTLKQITAASRNLANSASLTIATPVTTVVASNINSKNPDVAFIDPIISEAIEYETEVALLQNDEYTLLIIGNPPVKPSDVWLPPVESKLAWIGDTVPVPVVYWVSKKLWSLGQIRLWDLRLSWLGKAFNAKVYVLSQLNSTQKITTQPNILENVCS